MGVKWVTKQCIRLRGWWTMEVVWCGVVYCWLKVSSCVIMILYFSTALYWLMVPKSLSLFNSNLTKEVSLTLIYVSFLWHRCVSVICNYLFVWIITTMMFHQLFPTHYELIWIVWASPSTQRVLMVSLSSFKELKWVMNMPKGLLKPTYFYIISMSIISHLLVQANAH